MQPYIFLDLDDTLFQTLRKCHHVHPSELQLRATLPDGTPNSYATAKQQWLWQWLANDFKMVAVTARDYQAFKRVNLPFQEEVVLNHGAIILDKQRSIDPIWLERLLTELPPYYEKLLALWSDIEIFCAIDDNFKLRLVEDFGVTWYGVIKHKAATETALQPLLHSVIENHPSIKDGSLYWHLNGNNLAILPKIINKESAVAYLIETYKQHDSKVFTIGAGDSKTDVSFIALCDYALIPTQTQLFKLLAALTNPIHQSPN